MGEALDKVVRLARDYERLQHGKVHHVRGYLSKLGFGQNAPRKQYPTTADIEARYGRTQAQAEAPPMSTEDRLRESFGPLVGGAVVAARRHQQEARAKDAQIAALQAEVERLRAAGDKVARGR